MQPIVQWLTAHNLTECAKEESRLSGEALTYAVATYLRRPGDLPEEIVSILASDYFQKVSGAGVVEA